jgi:hypothetical protein
MEQKQEEEIDLNGYDLDITKHSDHAECGLRYFHLKLSLDQLEPSYTEENVTECKMKGWNIPKFTQMTESSYLRQHLKYWVYDLLMKNGGRTLIYCEPKYGLCHIPTKLRSKEDGRRELPTSIYKALLELDSTWKSKKVNLTWIVCYLNGIDIDTKKKKLGKIPMFSLMSWCWTKSTLFK